MGREKSECDYPIIINKPSYELTNETSNKQFLIENQTMIQKM